MKVDEKVVRKILQVNPELRDGRTTFQVKKDLESGHAIHTDGRRGTGAVGEAAGKLSAVPAAAGANRNELEETMAFFVRGKAEKLSEQLAAVAERRKALEDEERHVKEELKAQLASFIALLDAQQVALHGVAALSKHKEFLASLGLTPAQLLDAARKAKK